MKRLILFLFILGFVPQLFAWDDCSGRDYWLESRGWLWISPYGSKVGLYSSPTAPAPANFRFPWDPASSSFPIESFFLNHDPIHFGSQLDSEFMLSQLNTSTLLSGEYATAISGGDPRYSGKPFLRLRTYNFWEGNGWVLQPKWFNLADWPQTATFMTLARDGRTGGRWIEFDVATDWQYYAHYDNCGGYWDFVVGVFCYGTLSGGSGQNGNVYDRTVWRVRIDAVDGNNEIGGSLVDNEILSGVDVVSRLAAGPRSFAASQYWGATQHLDGAPVQFGFRGTVVNLPRSSSQFGFTGGSARIPIFLDPPETSKSIPSVVPVAIAPLN